MSFAPGMQENSLGSWSSITEEELMNLACVCAYACLRVYVCVCLYMPLCNYVRMYVLTHICIYCFKVAARSSCYSIVGIQDGREKLLAQRL